MTIIIYKKIRKANLSTANYKQLSLRNGEILCNKNFSFNLKHSSVTNKNGLLGTTVLFVSPY